jgi:hypothetical protein
MLVDFFVGRAEGSESSQAGYRYAVADGRRVHCGTVDRVWLPPVIGNHYRKVLQGDCRADYAASAGEIAGYSRNRDCFALCDGVDCHWRVVRRGR